ncbi:MAG: HEAT repeat domain-containing protein [Desulfobulbaceae bacterium]|nr:HEAT repeat domain-containing protein [Desulfobulbaceae bacterium]
MIRSLITDLNQSAPIDEQAVQALVLIGAPAVPYLIEALKSANTWLHAAEALAQIGQPAIKPLINLLKEADYSNLAFHALTSSGEHALSAFSEALEHEDIETRMWAIIGLQYIQDETAVQRILQALSDREPRIRILAVRALLQRKGTLPGAQLRVILEREPNADVRAELEKLVTALQPEQKYLQQDEK